jgi:acyl-lipid Delta6-acetylenase / acyl-lipid (9-3)-desaturase
VYDVSAFAAVHPGGPVLMTYAGKDATDVFAAFHAPETWGLLKQFLIGDLEVVGAQASSPSPKNAAASPLLADFRALRADMKARGLFVASVPYYAWKAASTVALGATAAACLLSAREGAAVGWWREQNPATGAVSWGAATSAAVVLALFWQQCGWLAHDFCHHQVSAARPLNNAAALALGNLAQGFSVAWWKGKHNQHHAAPNELAGVGSTAALDPDIDTLPLLAWSPAVVEALPPGAPERALLRVQHFLFLPILLAARLAWAAQSVTTVLDLARRRAPGAALEVAGLAAHYALYLGAAFASLPPLSAAVWALGAQAACGLLLALVFVQSHNGMEVYTTTHDFVTAQAVSTRDISPGPWADWFTGGLNYQIEHHLFPGLPRHNLGLAAPAVAALFAKHGLAYEACGMATGTRRVMQTLAGVAALA